MIRLIPFFCLALTFAGPALAERITVFAAASLRGVLEEVADLSDDGVALSYGGSGTMARQTAAGAPVDVIVLASPLWMTWLAEQGVDGAADAVSVARNTLVVVGAPGAAPFRAPKTCCRGCRGGAWPWASATRFRRGPMPRHGCAR